MTDLTERDFFSADVSSLGNEHLGHTIHTASVLGLAASTERSKRRDGDALQGCLSALTSHSSSYKEMVENLVVAHG